MADLLRMLGYASQALEAQRFGLDVAGQNIANVNTPGYSRRVLDLAALPPVEQNSAGRGVEAVRVRSLRDQFIARRLLAEYPSQRREQAMADALGVVEVALGAAGASLDKQLDDFFDAWAGVADAPTSAPARQEIVLQGQSLAATFHDMSQRLAAAVSDTDDRVRATVQEINQLARRIADLNEALTATPPTSGENLHLRDEIGRTIDELSGLVDVTAAPRSDGGVDVELVGSGRPLAIGKYAYTLDVVNRATSGLAEIESGGVAVTASIAGGTLGGLLRVRDTCLPDYRTQLDELAFTVAKRVNDVHADGLDLSGAAGGLFFDDLATSDGAATVISMRAELRAPGGETLVAAAGAGGGVGDNANARALAALRSERMLAGGTATPADAWAQLVYSAGRDTAAARDALRSRAEVVTQIRNLQDSVSGVSLDEEAADMIRFQRAYEANAQYFRAIDETLDVLMQTFGI